ncbi:MAG: hypothetical protein Q9214_007450 [Letrouitia sp. 1 TL-2023]
MPKEKSTRKTKAKAADSGKKKKDPNAPKRGLSAYMFFANDNREAVREENPGISFGKGSRYLRNIAFIADHRMHHTGQVGKVLGEKWKALNPKQREPYEQKAKADKERYESEKASYAAGGDDEESEE